MLLLIGGIALAVIYLAVKAPDVNTAQNKEALPPNDNVPMLGSVGNPSPAMSNGRAVASQLFRNAMTVNAAPVGSAFAKFAASGMVKQLNAQPGTFRPPTQTVAEMGKTLMTQAPPTLTSSTSDNPIKQVIKL